MGKLSFKKWQVSNHVFPEAQIPTTNYVHSMNNYILGENTRPVTLRFKNQSLLDLHIQTLWSKSVTKMTGSPQPSDLGIANTDL